MMYESTFKSFEIYIFDTWMIETRELYFAEAFPNIWPEVNLSWPGYANEHSKRKHSEKRRASVLIQNSLQISYTTNYNIVTLYEVH